MAIKQRVLVIGGGAAGLVAGISAARNGAEVIILEALNRVGKKILATGNGRCNLTNIHMDINRFHGRSPKFALAALKQFDVEQTMSFFDFLGIKCKVEEGGKVYPTSDQASSVLDVLRYELQQLNVREECEKEVVRIKKANKYFEVIAKDGSKIKGDKVIVATGGMASPQLGSNGGGYNLLVDLGHKLIDPIPALVQVTLDADFLKKIKGVKFNGEASLINENQPIGVEGGEILFTDYGISGPPILQLSRGVSQLIKENKTPIIKVDLFPEIIIEDLIEQIQLRLAYHPKKPLDTSFIGLINKKLIPVVLKEAGINRLQKPCSQVNSTEINAIASVLKNWSFRATGTQPWRHAQVTAGGINVDDVNSKSLESKLVKGLYIVGELLDIDGDCGGYNLQWAWSSGFIAGEAAALNFD
ncbi:NAD(P)/FAD-dependent oxidoreductase [Alkaliphilus pronyensis]|uniref:NAD(P)/FAD-dependent oxidoreductase n=1 Tax=Alkaliphilus pronyensis TaxID=1482732 RepID=A0A6I0EYW4_9FIRM|nr:NAD(P)/FAD-dependent oxidoreductase [Alkaliphilus pronyensis]KAB3531264.1 NAD(P)/FAD-dependent oxidoreductase [Alkaliphilus pronyensis]